MKYHNPILKGFHPDPSICKVNNDFYLVTSSFQYFPGIPIYHSRDLVNWKQIGNCINRPEQLPMEKAKSSGGIWAPTIRYYEGIFYVTATFDGIGNFIISSKDPAKDWSDPVWVNFSGIDPSLFFEDGNAYYCANDYSTNQKKDMEGISLAKIDIATGNVIGEIKRIWTGTGGGFIEAPHIYHIGPYYYILTAEGGTSFNHMVTIGRSRNIWGPYETCPDNPILTNRNDNTKQIACTGHGDLFKDSEENWWMVHLGTRPVQGMSSLGRETFLTPVTWKDFWPCVGINKKCRLEMEGPISSPQREPEKWDCDFTDQKMEMQWLFLRKPDRNRYFRAGGSLTLTASKESLKDPFGSPTFLAMRQMDAVFEAQANCSICIAQEGNLAGITVYQSETLFYRMGIMRENGDDILFVEKQVQDLDFIVYRKKLEQSVHHINLKITSDGLDYYFYYQYNGNEELLAQKGSCRLLSCELAGKCFTGALIGFFAEGGSQNTTIKLSDFSCYPY